MNSTYPDVIGLLASKTNLPPNTIIALLVASAVWTVIWKGFGLWRAARNQEKYWFIAMLIINDLGLIAIVYLLWFRKDKRGMMPPASPAAPITVPPADVA